MKGVVFWPEAERWRLEWHCSDRASKDARQAAWADVAVATAVEDEEWVVGAAAVAEAVIAGVAEAGSAEG